MKSNKFSSGDRISLEDFNELCNYSGLKNTYIASKVLKVDQSSLLSLQRGKIKFVSIMMNGRFLNKESKDNFFKNIELLKEIKSSSYTLEEIENIANKYSIEVKDLIVNLFGKDCVALERLKRGEIKQINYDGILVDYKSPKCPPLPFLNAEDLNDSVIYNQEEFDLYFKNVTTKDDLLNAIKQFRQNKIRKEQELQSKYDIKYIELLKKYANDEIINSNNFDTKKQYYSNYKTQYFQQLYEIMKRNPKYFKGIDKEEFEKIAKDFNISPPILYSKMFGREPYTYKNCNNIHFHPRYKVTIPVSVQEVLAEDIMKICNNITKIYDLNYADKQDLKGELISILLNYGGVIIYNIDEDKNIDDLIGMMGGYAKKISKYLVGIMDANKKMLKRNNNSDGQTIKEDHDKVLIDKASNVEEQAIENTELLQNFDLEMLELLQSNSTYLTILAKKLNISVEELKKMVDSFIDDKTRPDNADLEEAFGEQNLSKGIPAKFPTGNPKNIDS